MYNRTATLDTACNEPRSSSGPGHRPFKAEITGSNPVRGTYLYKKPGIPIVRSNLVYQAS